VGVVDIVDSASEAEAGPTAERVVDDDDDATLLELLDAGKLMMDARGIIRIAAVHAAGEEAAGLETAGATVAGGQ